MCAVPTGSSGRGWGLTSWGRDPTARERGRRAFMLPTLVNTKSPNPTGALGMP